MRILLDTCAISELRQKAPRKSVLDAIDAAPSENLFLSVITLGELAKGISLLAEGTRKNNLQRWLIDLERYYGDRILPIDADTARIWGELTADAQKKGVQVGASDGLIAATARRHGLHVMTRNASDFEQTGVLLVNPWIGP